MSKERKNFYLFSNNYVLEKRNENIPNLENERVYVNTTVRSSFRTPKLTEKYVPFKMLSQDETKITGKDFEAMKSYNVRHIKKAQKMYFFA